MTDEALMLLGEEGAICWVNAATAELLGFSQEELVLHALPALLSSRDPAALSTMGPVARGFWAVRSGEVKESNGQARFLTRAGEKVNVRWRLWALPVNGSRAEFLLSMVRQKLVSEDDDEETRYRDIFHYALEGIYRMSLAGEYSEVNPAMAQIYGYGSPQAFLDAVRDEGRDHYLHPDRRAELLRLAHEQGFVRDVESPIRRADLSRGWVSESVRIVRDSQGRATHVEGSVIEVTARRAAEAALKQSEDRFRQLVEMSNVVPWEGDLHTGRFTYVGPQARAFLGYAIEDWLAEGFWQRTAHEEDREWVGIVRGEALQNRQHFECEYRMVRPDGRVVWVREIASLLAVDEQEARIGGFFFDVSYRRETEESLRESQHLVEQIATASPTILYLYDPERRQCIYVNGRVSSMLGYSREALAEMYPLFILSLSHPSESATHERHFAALQEVASSEILEREFRLRSGAGSWIWLHSRECVFKRDGHGKVTQVLGTIEDITLYRNVIEELETNEALFRKLAETARVIPFDYDPASTRFRYVGPQAESLLGRPTTYWQNLGSWLTLLHPDDFDEGTLFASEEMFRPGQDFEAEFRLRAADGRYLWLRQIVHCGSEEDQRDHVRGFLFDISEAKAAEQERERSRHQLRELSARTQEIREDERKSIARDLHDELGQALTMLKLDLSWLGGRVARSVPVEALPPLDEKIRGMEQTIGNTLQTIRRILSALRPPLLDELGLAAAVEWHATDFARRTNMRCDLRIDLPETVSIDAALAVFRVFQEITTNIARHALASRMTVDLRIRESFLVLLVTDNGRGISEEDQKKPGHFGLLGLRERAWAFGGQLSVTGAPGKGTTVRLDFPVDRVIAPALPPPDHGRMH